MAEVKPLPSSPDAKKQQVEQMFDSISSRYDLLNRLLSLGIDRGWRKKVRKAITAHGAKYILDVATGTADMAIELCVNPQIDKVIGVDISAGMLHFGQRKIANKKLDNRIALQQADSEALPFDNNTFDACTVCFGVRNFENLETGMKEMVRVLKPGGMLIVLEFSKPRSALFKHIYWFYFGKVLPTLGKVISGSNNAYRYLPESVKVFPDGEAFLKIMRESGLSAVEAQPLTFGICTLYKGIR